MKAERENIEHWTPNAERWRAEILAALASLRSKVMGWMALYPGVALADSRLRCATARRAGNPGLISSTPSVSSAGPRRLGRSWAGWRDPFGVVMRRATRGRRLRMKRRMRGPGEGFHFYIRYVIPDGGIKMKLQHWNSWKFAGVWRC